MKRSQDQVALQPPSAGTAAGTTPAGAPSNYPLTPAGNASAGVTISMPMVGAASYDSGRVRRKKTLQNDTLLYSNASAFFFIIGSFFKSPSGMASLSHEQSFSGAQVSGFFIASVVGAEM